MNKLLGNRIKELRCAKDLTQEQLANKIGISRQKYARIENGTNNVTLDILSKISRVLGCAVRDITRVLDEEPQVEYRAGSKNSSTKEIFDMLDLFYANKEVYDRLQQNRPE